MRQQEKQLSPVGLIFRQRGLVQARVAQQIGESKQNLNKIIRGQTKISKAWAEKLQPVLGMAWEDILRLDENSEIVQATLDDHDRFVEIMEMVVPPDRAHDSEITPPAKNGKHFAVAQWRMPGSYLKAFAASPADVRIVRVAGDSMEPDYPSGERVLVDTSHKIPSPPGIYVLWDGFGLILKRLEILPGSKPPVVRIKSINPGYEAYEMPLTEMLINGRVIGKWTWK
jgi:plasmid maintenance system antidote protein VapI